MAAVSVKRSISKLRKLVELFFERQCQGYKWTKTPYKLFSQLNLQ